MHIYAVLSKKSMTDKLFLRIDNCDKFIGVYLNVEVWKLIPLLKIKYKSLKSTFFEAVKMIISYKLDNSWRNSLKWGRVLTKTSYWTSWKRIGKVNSWSSIGVNEQWTKVSSKSRTRVYSGLWRVLHGFHGIKMLEINIFAFNKSW